MRSERHLAERLVWQCLENHADTFRCWRMTEQEIATELNLGVATVSRAVRALEADKIIDLERSKRRPTKFRMLRNYPKPNGQHPPSPDDLTHHSDMSTSEFTTQGDGSTVAMTHQDDRSTAPQPTEMTTHGDQSTMQLTHRGDASSPELTHHGDKTSNPPVRTHQKKNPPVARGRAPEHRAKPLPTDWKPSARCMILGRDLGMTQAEVLGEVDRMRDWALHKGEVSHDWDRRFANWLRDTHQRRLSPLRLVTQATPMQTREARYEAVKDAFRRGHADALAHDAMEFMQ
jgi:hypothetical protein